MHRDLNTQTNKSLETTFIADVHLPKISWKAFNSLWPASNQILMGIFVI